MQSRALFRIALSFLPGTIFETHHTPEEHSTSRDAEGGPPAAPARTRVISRCRGGRTCSTGWWVIGGSSGEERGLVDSGWAVRSTEVGCGGVGGGGSLRTR